MLQALHDCLDALAEENRSSERWRSKYEKHLKEIQRKEQQIHNKILKPDPNATPVINPSVSATNANATNGTNNVAAAAISLLPVRLLPNSLKSHNSVKKNVMSSLLSSSTTHYHSTIATTTTTLTTHSELGNSNNVCEVTGKRVADKLIKATSVLKSKNAAIVRGLGNVDIDKLVEEAEPAHNPVSHSRPKYRPEEV